MDWNKDRLFSDKALGQDEEGKERQDGIRRGETNERTKLLR